MLRDQFWKILFIIFNMYFLQYNNSTVFKYILTNI